MILSGLIFYLLSAVVYVHQALKGYGFDPTQIGGLHHETLIVLFWSLSKLCFNISFFLTNAFNLFLA